MYLLNNKERYRQFCKTASGLPLFMQAWWLDAVCANGNWETALTLDRGGAITGVLPYFQTRKKGILIITNPPLTPHLGVWLVYPENLHKTTRRYAFEKRTITGLIGQLPPVWYYSQSQPITLQNWLPFYWQGFQQTTMYTYEIAADQTEAQIWAGLKSSVRNKIEKASGLLELKSGEYLRDFYAINEKTFARQGLKVPFSFSFLTQLDEALAQRQQRKIVLAVDASGEPHAGIYLVWDQQRMYNLALGADTDLRSSGAIQLLLWEGIRLSRKKGLVFDFEGGMIENIEPVFRDFGARQLAYHRLYRFRSPLLRAFYDWWKK